MGPSSKTFEWEFHSQRSIVTSAAVMCSALKLLVSPRPRVEVAVPAAMGSAELVDLDLTASEVNWIAGKPVSPLRLAVQIRHRHRAAPEVARPR